MKVYKFGGASVKNAESIKNVASIVSKCDCDSLGVIVSAMGKTTNALEKIAEAVWQKDLTAVKTLSEETISFHHTIAADLFGDNNHPIFNFIGSIFNDINEKPIVDSFNFVYDQIVSLGEVLSTKIIADYLEFINISVQWIDARTLVRTDNKHREGDVDWSETQRLFNANFTPLFKTKKY